MVAAGLPKSDPVGAAAAVAEVTAGTWPKSDPVVGADDVATGD